MTTSISNDIEIQVECTYLNEHSRPSKLFHFFGYKISIVNRNKFPVRLLSRYWHIKDCGFEDREVKGAGVVGQQPIIKPFDGFSYNSGCDFKSFIGSMNGYYVFRNLETQETFKAKIPEFICQANYTLN